jgi:hypothetical protein
MTYRFCKRKRLGSGSGGKISDSGNFSSGNFGDSRRPYGDSRRPYLAPALAVAGFRSSPNAIIITLMKGVTSAMAIGTSTMKCMAVGTAGSIHH